MEENFTLTYLCKFDENGTRGETYDTAGMSKEEKQSKLDAGFIEITEEEWHYLVGNMGTGDNNTGYIYDVANKEVKSAPPAPEPTKAERADILASEYEANISALKQDIVLAMADGDSELVDELKTEKASVLTEYQSKLREIKNG